MDFIDVVASASSHFCTLCLFDTGVLGSTIDRLFGTVRSHTLSRQIHGIGSSGLPISLDVLCCLFDFGLADIFESSDQLLSQLLLRAREFQTALRSVEVDL
jgi:hypothetical protein